ncbi:MAG TPA: LptA/OstA family protein, partial [Pyrinomonadaceae bacterium]|nr:LptA/OstA family protein [Pyrinomonadaceae bacterium]
SEKPVFITSDSAEFDHNTETANYTGNARGWQDANYVRGNRIYLDQRAGKLLAEGSVQTALYNARIRQKGKETNVPTYAAAATMTYERDKRLLQYRTAVDIRQGTDRITAGAADVYLDEKNELSRTVAESNVVITQPNRKATGDWAEYAAGEETAVLRGSPATVSDAESGSSQSPQLTFYMRENRVVSAQQPKQTTPGRSRSVYKVKPNP